MNEKTDKLVIELGEVAVKEADLPGAVSDIKSAEKAQVDDKKEINGPKGLEPTRYGDWESKGRCYDF